MRKDDLGLFEAYDQVVNNQQVLEEGILDRIKAGASSAMASFQPKKRIGAAVASGLGKIAGNFSPEAGQRLQQVGDEKRTEIAAAGNTAKVSSILKSQKNSITKLANDIINDLNKLGLNTKGMTADQVSNSLYSEIETMLTGTLASSSNVAASPTKTSSAPSGKPLTQHFASDIGATDDSMYQKYKDGWYNRSGSKASGFSYSKVTDKNIINSLEKLP